MPFQSFSPLNFLFGKQSVIRNLRQIRGNLFFSTLLRLVLVAKVMNLFGFSQSCPLPVVQFCADGCMGTAGRSVSVADSFTHGEYVAGTDGFVAFQVFLRWIAFGGGHAQATEVEA